MRFLALLVLFAGGCSTVQVSKFAGPDGKEYFEATCRVRNGVGPCLKRATHLCEGRGGYKLVEPAQVLPNVETKSVNKMQVFFACNEAAH